MKRNKGRRVRRKERKKRKMKEEERITLLNKIGKKVNETYYKGELIWKRRKNEIKRNKGRRATGNKREKIVKEEEELIC